MSVVVTKIDAPVRRRTPGGLRLSFNTRRLQCARGFASGEKRQNSNSADREETDGSDSSAKASSALRRRCGRGEGRWHRLDTRHGARSRLRAERNGSLAALE